MTRSIPPPSSVELAVGDHARDLDQRVPLEVEPGHLAVDPHQPVVHPTKVKGKNLIPNGPVTTPPAAAPPVHPVAYATDPKRTLSATPVKPVDIPAV